MTLRTVDWMICERGQRWQTAAYRFSPEMLPPETVAAIAAVSIEEITKLVRLRRSPLLIWEVHPANVLAVVDGIATLHRHRSSSVARISQTASAENRSPLHLVADLGLAQAARHALSEMGVAAFLRHPEELARLRTLIHHHFADPGTSQGLRSP